MHPTAQAYPCGDTITTLGIPGSVFINVRNRPGMRVPNVFVR